MIVSLLSWFEEHPDWLRDTVSSLERAGVSHLIAVDGAYALFPAARAASHPRQRQAIRQAAEKAGIDCTIHVPSAPWPGEVEKRTEMFRLGEEVTSEADWYLVIDADEVVLMAPDDLHRRLAETTLDVAELKLIEPKPSGVVQALKHRALFRALRGLRVERNHYTYVTRDGRRLWGRGRLEPTLELLELEVEHRTFIREDLRRNAALAYYKRRDRAKVEFGSCEVCNENAADYELPTGWRLESEGKLSSTWLSVCEACAPDVRKENREVVQSFGLDPATIQVTFEKAAA